jgi:hypothetical protein
VSHYTWHVKYLFTRFSLLWQNVNSATVIQVSFLLLVRMSDAFSGEIVTLAVERNLESEANQGDI